MNKTTNIYALVERNSNRAVIITESGMIDWFKQQLPGFEVIEVEQISSATFSFSEGIITTTSIYPINKPFSKDAYHIINKFPDNMNLGEAYQLINNK